MELRTIQTFLHVAELHSFSQAAREQGYSQSAVPRPTSSSTSSLR